jgi:hypothetical protein
MQHAGAHMVKNYLIPAAREIWARRKNKPPTYLSVSPISGSTTHDPSHYFLLRPADDLVLYQSREAHVDRAQG